MARKKPNQVIRFAAQEIEGCDGPHRWTACGKDAAAILLGFERPTNYDDSGLWRHEEFGEVEDDRMSDAVSFILRKWTGYHQKDDINGALDLVRIRAEELAEMLDLATNTDVCANKRQKTCAVKLVAALRKVSLMAAENSV